MQKLDLSHVKNKMPIFRFRKRMAVIILDRETELISDALTSNRKDMLTMTATVITLSLGSMYALKDKVELASNFLVPIALTVGHQFIYGLGERYRAKALFQKKARENYQRDQMQTFIGEKPSESENTQEDYLIDYSGNSEFAYAFWKLADLLFIGSYISLGVIVLFTLQVLGFRIPFWILIGFIVLATIKVLADIYFWDVKGEPRQIIQLRFSEKLVNYLDGLKYFRRGKP